ncbi:C-type lectin 37Db-like [Scaptodrosophila lebanonensis]|uniref:C-type lectin 37Db-like n=1 Tax=Drosophila lebanonensis TaxID=7225 RepID=A0A6J2U5M7_DROLE|nr:C-type lectin 37Db-like [Scaptodrosophila lebanonensis]
MRSALSALSIVILLSMTLAKCPNKFVQIGKKCYYVFTQKTDWLRAERKCRQLNAHLVVFEDQQEVDLLTNYLEEKGVVLTVHPRWWDESIWIGITDLDNTRNFIVEHTKQPMRYTLWGPGEPNYWFQQCVAAAKVTQADSLSYHDFVCEEQAKVVCEHPILGRRESMNEVQISLKLSALPYYCASIQRTCGENFQKLDEL